MLGILYSVEINGMVRPPNDGVHLETPQAQTGSSSEGVRSARICMHELICRDGKNFVLGDNIKFIPVSTAPRIDFHLKTEA